MPDVSGVYCIENTITDKKYVGKAVNIRKRFLEHRCRLRNNYHGNPYLQKAWNKYGEETFKFYVLETCERNDVLLSEREIYYIKKLDTFSTGYNLTAGGEGTSGRRATDSQKEKIGRANRGKPSPRKGKTLSLETILKISASKIGHVGLKGETNPSSKLSSDDVRKIKEMFSEMSNTKISKLFNVSPITIGRIRKGRSWKDEQYSNPKHRG